MSGYIRHIRWHGLVPTHRVVASELRRISAVEFRIFFQDHPDAVVALMERNDLVAYIASPERLAHLNEKASMIDHTPTEPTPPGSHNALSEQAVLDVFKRARTRKVFSSWMLAKRSGLHYSTSFAYALGRLVKRGVLIEVSYNRFKMKDG